MSKPIIRMLFEFPLTALWSNTWHVNIVVVPPSYTRRQLYFVQDTKQHQRQPFSRPNHHQQQHLYDASACHAQLYHDQAPMKNETTTLNPSQMKVLDVIQGLIQHKRQTLATLSSSLGWPCVNSWQVCINQYMWTYVSRMNVGERRIINSPKDIHIYHLSYFVCYRSEPSRYDIV